MNENKIVLNDRKNLFITGIKKVVSVSPDALFMELESSELCVYGDNMEVKKLDVENGTLEVEGKIDNIKYQNKKEKMGLIRKIFK